MKKLTLNHRLTFLTPYIFFLILIYCFASLGFWQLDRAQEKDALNKAYLSDTSYIDIQNQLAVNTYQQIQASGSFIQEKQIIIDNIIRNGQLGQMIITPFEINHELPWLLVNRGWVKKIMDSNKLSDIKINSVIQTIKGRSGNLPRIGIRDSVAFDENTTWPAVGIYPTIEEIEIQLQQNILPYILLLGPEEENGFKRSWAPRVSSTSNNYGYAIQWFLMCFGVIILLINKLKKFISNQKK